MLRQCTQCRTQRPKSTHFTKHDWVCDPCFGQQRTRAAAAPSPIDAPDGGEGGWAEWSTGQGGYGSSPVKESSPSWQARGWAPANQPPPRPLQQVSKQWQALDDRREELDTAAIQQTQAAISALKAAIPDVETRRHTNATSYAQQAMSTRPGAHYRGPHLAFPLTGAQAHQLVLSFAERPQEALHESYLCQLLTRAIALFAKQPRVVPLQIARGTHKRLVVVGDLHGQLEDLLTIFITNGYPQSGETCYVFNGDFVDRGPWGVEVVVVLLVFKLLYPDSVHLNRGNHEDAALNTNYGFTNEVKMKYGNNLLHCIFCDLWNVLPLVTTIDNRICVMHGGLSRFNGVRVADFDTIPRTEFQLDSPQYTAQLMVDTVWADPMPQYGRLPSERCPGSFLFGPDVTAHFLQTNSMNMVIRSHQVPPSNRGCETMHEGQLLIVFSASNYCGVQGNLGGIVVFTPDGGCVCKEYMAPDLAQCATSVADMGAALLTPPPAPSAGPKPEPKPSAPPPQRRSSASSASSAVMDAAPPAVGPSPPEAKRPTPSPMKLRSAGTGDPDEAHAQVVQYVMQLIVERQDDLYRYYAALPQTEGGAISIGQWTSGLDAILCVDVVWAWYQPELVTLTTQGEVDWKKWLQEFQPVVSKTFLAEMQQHIHDVLMAQDLSLNDCARLFDGFDGDGMVTLDELQAALPGLGLKVTPLQARALLSQAVAMPGGRVTFERFMESLTMRFSGRQELTPSVQATLNLVGILITQSGLSAVTHFRELDLSGDGLLQLDEFKGFLEWLASQHPTYKHLAEPGHAEEVFKAIDVDGNGQLNIIEFMDAFKPGEDVIQAHTSVLVSVMTKALQKSKVALGQIFHLLDVDGTGDLTPREFVQGLKAMRVIMGDVLTDADVELIAKHIDKDGNGKISYPEFLQAFSPPKTMNTHNTKSKVQ
uniref:Serine/threonine-protein phosphatase n=1 Tax=Eutreptiella gymnastica TaxID=73025 RepID=A0A7S1J132_9EUGL|mmetsp:Transcript_58135/g.103737  ORF Transcript_58135/g.103737 Transcript_58135/m.103737 type:complete len:931 (+) Transcript_58135:46-2838(+)